MVEKNKSNKNQKEIDNAVEQALQAMEMNRVPYVMVVPGQIKDNVLVVYSSTSDKKLLWEILARALFVTQSDQIERKPSKPSKH